LRSGKALLVILIIKDILKVHEFSEEYRHQCEVRQVIKWRVQDRTKAMDYIIAVRNKRGDNAADLLHKESAEQWAKGNRGLDGEWK